MWFSKRNSNFGNSLLTVLGATTILGVVAYYSSQSLVNRVKANRGLATKTEFSNLVDYIHLILSDSATCQLNFKGKIIAVDITAFQTNNSFDPTTFQLVVPGLLSGTKNLAKVGDKVGDMTLTEIKFKVEGKLGAGLSASLNFKVEKPQTTEVSRSSGVTERSSRIMLNVITAPTANANEVVVVDCTANSLIGATPSPTSTSPALSGAWAPFPNGLGERYGSTAVWTGAKLIVWGGTSKKANNALDLNYLSNTGSVYDPANGTLVPISNQNAPSPRASAWSVGGSSRPEDESRQ